MKKLIVIGDIHGNPLWKEIVKKHGTKNVLYIFVGDYFDSFIYNCLDQIHNFNEIIQFKKENIDNVILLIGNHDYQYFSEIPDKGLTSGYQGDAKAYNITVCLIHNREYLQMAFSYENYLFTHAGLSPIWIKEIENYVPIESPNLDAQSLADYINMLWEFKPLIFKFISGGDSSGNDKYQSPIWIRPTALIESWINIKNNITQIVGHTKQIQIDIKDKFIFIDTINTNNEYLIIENNTVKSDKI